jgi:glycosyltransferase involved in cell wall biosynthesis
VTNLRPTPDAAAPGSSPVDAAAQRAIASSEKARDAGRDRPGVLHVLHARGGGTEKHVRELVASTRDRFRHYLLRNLPDRYRLLDLHGAVPDRYDYRWRLADAPDEVSRFDFPRNGDDRWLREIAAWLALDLVHVHSLVESGEDFPRLLASSGIPYCYTAHDMYLPCPTIHLIDDRGEYCNATTDVDACRRCLAALGTYADVDIVRWRERHAGFLARAAEVHGPSRWARETLETYFPGVDVAIVPPPPPRLAANAPAPAPAFDLPADANRHVALIGAIGPEKGARILDALVARIRERALPLRVVVIGYTDRTTRGQSDDRVLTVHGPYGVAEVAPLLDRYRVDVVLFPNVWPETWSYTLGEAWAAGRPVLVPPRGAPRERVDATGAGWILAGWPDADATLDQLLHVTAPEQAPMREAASARARDAAQASHEDAIVPRYRGILAAASPRAPVEVSRRRIEEAARRALARDSTSDAPHGAATGASPAASANRTPPSGWRALLHRLGRRA